MNPEPDQWRLIDWLWAPFGGLVGVVWSMLTGRIKQVDEDSKTRSAEHYREIERQRDVGSKIFDELGAIRKDMNANHMQTITLMHDGLDKKVDK